MVIPMDMVALLEEVDEAIIKQAADMAGPDNNFHKLLVYGEKFRKAGMEPIYLTTKDQMNFTVSSRETFAKKLH